MQIDIARLASPSKRIKGILWPYGQLCICGILGQHVGMGHCQPARDKTRQRQSSTAEARRVTSSSGRARVHAGRTPDMRASWRVGGGQLAHRTRNSGCPGAEGPTERARRHRSVAGAHVSWRDATVRHALVRRCAPRLGPRLDPRHPQSRQQPTAWSTAELTLGEPDGTPMATD